MIYPGDQYLHSNQYLFDYEPLDFFNEKFSSLTVINGKLWFWILEKYQFFNIFYTTVQNIFNLYKYITITKKINFFIENFSLKKPMKIQNFEISDFFRKFFEISKFWIFIDFFIEKNFGQKSENFGPKKFRPKVFGFFSTKKISTNFFRTTYFDPKWSQDSENHT